MGNWGKLDVSDLLVPYVARWVGQLLFAVLCTIAAILLRIGIDAVEPGAGVFALMFPAVLVATLFGRWESGLATLLLLMAFLWFFVLPPTGTFHLANGSDASRIAVNFLSGLSVLILAEVFRREVRRGIEDRELFLREIDHRVKNNFAMVTSLLDMQRRRTTDQATGAALLTAQNRVQSIARAHRHLYRGARDTGVIEMKVYLEELCLALASSLFLGDSVVLVCNCEPARLSRDRAVAVGLVVNELVTNAAKHAFTKRERGRISVDFAATDTGWRLTVADNGTGFTDSIGTSEGLGHRIIDGFSRQANGVIQTTSNADGSVFILDLQR